MNATVVYGRGTKNHGTLIHATSVLSSVPYDLPLSIPLSFFGSGGLGPQVE